MKLIIDADADVPVLVVFKNNFGGAARWLERLRVINHHMNRNNKCNKLYTR